MEKPTAIYVHIPFCKARCGYCAFSSCTDFSLREKYVDVLSHEISSAVVPDGTVIKTLYWGGGTPSVVPIKYLEKIYNEISKKFQLSLEEFTVECNPESTDIELLRFLKSIGVNRISFGLQSVNDSSLKKIGRLHDFKTFSDVLSLSLSCGFSDINADLILGLPESVDEFRHSVQTVANLPLTHVSVYALEIHDENTSFKKLCQSFNYSDDDLADMYDYAFDVFEKSGFLRYEVSNFAKLGMESKHNLNYWREGRYFGFGAAASGFVDNIRYGNAFDICKYILSDGKGLEYRDEISLDDEMKEFVMLGLRLAEGIDATVFEKRFGKSFYSVFPEYKTLSKSGFLSLSNGKIFVPKEKFYVLNSILTDLI